MNLFDFMHHDKQVNQHRVYGVTVGIVTNNKDPEKLGRVKVKLPTRLGEKELEWARIVTLMAGQEMGMFFLPEVGDEVLVTFREGDIREPYVIGSLWNAQEKPPETNEDGKNNIRMIKSRSGHEISIIDDDDGAIEIKTKNGNAINILDKGNGKIEINDKSGSNKITIDGDGKKVEITGDSKLELKSKSCSIVIDGNSSSVEIKSSTKLSIESTNVDIKAKANLNISSDGMVNIKGSMVKIN
ncbi:phage baseplate assembly protein V [Wukongibacter baidiensis]|uniref:phage baseplate assembly protein V n=1 Tax=Wukongibacter baidiensis TaxID=1723361 RepID=UPI003D7F9769